MEATMPDTEPYCGVPERFALGLTWSVGPRGRLEFRFHRAKNEQGMLTQLSDWLGKDERNPYRLAEWMRTYEASFERSAFDALADRVRRRGGEAA
jgi:hypothetical protein